MPNRHACCARVLAHGYGDSWQHGVNSLDPETKGIPGLWCGTQISAGMSEIGMEDNATVVSMQN